MKKLFTLLLSALTVLITYAKPVSPEAAQTVATTFLKEKTNITAFKNLESLSLAYESHSKYDLLKEKITYFYIFNIGTSKGFIIVAGDDVVKPVLGYSDEGTYDPVNTPPNVAKWIEGYRSQIRYVITNHISATKEISAEWDQLLSGKVADMPEDVMAVNPLVNTKWNQSPYYNADCPYDNTYNDRTVAGCVATAMAQIMKYWNYPATGSGFHSYNSNKYGTLSANFGSTAYQWSSMPNTVNSANSAVATLIYHCGVSVDMNYGVSATGGSGAYVISSSSPVTHCSEYALKTYFGYKSSISGKKRAFYTDQQWISLLKGELDAGRPILYAGFGGGGGHAFVCDGYDNSNFFHMNWGWGGAYDGFFSINALNPTGVGTGGGTGGYNSDHQALIGIEPPTTNPNTADLVLYDNLTVSSSTLYYGQSFSVSTNFWNTGNKNFSGDFTVAVFDANLNFLDYVETLTGYSLSSGYVYSSNVVFSNAGMLNMLPGTYYVAAFYRNTGGNWVLVGDNGGYSNLTQITVNNINDIEMYAAMSVSPGITLTNGNPVSVSLDVANYSNLAFNGLFDLSLYNMDGSYAFTIEELDNLSLCSNCHFQNGLTFSNSKVNVAPGSYLMAVQHKSTGGNYELTGSSYYQNPIIVTVQEAALTGDQYENNNSIGQSYNLSVNFSGNTAIPNTSGSNIHVGNDYDYYKVYLPVGYKYTLTPRLHDSYNSGNGNIYTLDALFSYSDNGTSWSEVYDDVLPGSFTIHGGQTCYFYVSPYFTGETGTYLLDIKISRTAVSGIDDQDLSVLNIFPNPATELIYVDAAKMSTEVKAISLLSISGQELVRLEGAGQQDKFVFDCSEYASGVYIINVQTSNGSVKRKVIVNR